MTTIRPQTTLDDIKRLAAQLGVTFTANRDSFDLDKSAPIEVHGTYRNNQAGINASFSVLVRLQDSERRLLAYWQDSERDIERLRRRIRRRRGIGTSGAFVLFFLIALVAYVVGTVAPQTRGVAGPLTILCMFLIVVNAVVAALAHARK